ncbi:hypothetical protein [Aliiglaciecola lipolytica]|uniref:SMODS and SLOG-associating 2TM effector domain-containing protein n=1 Tax=Aliiglaciecola lipolytica E3 TaxID=1127673 RepID=K6YSW1_9ALTE|nr:hypothetical protein [Aliiglaciecola lipolytica]GAC14375.1 hypothetical protein GLIP_1742 [Aliiglaciecola lipolytica E3]
MSSALTINIGVTGHRDIPEHDIPILEKALLEELTSLQKKCPRSTIQILSGLAEGADQLMVKVALKLKLKVTAVLPFDVQEYEKDFRSPQSLETFRRLFEQCSEVKICQREANSPRVEGYTALGKTLVGCSDYLIAIWDGVIDHNKGSSSYAVKPGGTADVVRMCIEGLVDESSLLFSKPNKTYCKWLVSTRSRHASLPVSVGSKKDIGSWKTIDAYGVQNVDLFNEILAKTERFNTGALRIKKKDKAESLAHLIGEQPPTESLAAIKHLVDAYCVADCLAQIRQQQRLKSLKWITTLSFFAIFAQQIYVGLYATVSWFLIHVFLVGVVVSIYWLFFVGSESKEEQYVEWRVFAEDLRVQIFWHLSGIPDHSANNYRTTKLYEMDWIVDNLNKLMLQVPKPNKQHIHYVRKVWILDQRNYFYGQRGERGRAFALLNKSKQYQRNSIFLFCLAIALMFFSVAKIQFNLIPAFSTSILFIIIAMSFISSALLKTFAVQMGFEELSQRYLRTGYFFQQAMNRMSLLDETHDSETDNIESYQRVIKIIGIEALNENAAWLQLHKMNAYQVQVS